MIDSVALELQQLREDYQLAVSDVTALRKLWQQLRSYRGTNAQFLAYKAGTRALMARDSWNPMDKLSKVREAMKYFREAVNQAPESIEIRFLRFTIQDGSPDMFDLRREMNIDKNAMIRYWGQYKSQNLNPADMYKFLKYFRESDHFSESELNSLEDQLPSSE